MPRAALLVQPDGDLVLPRSGEDRRGQELAAVARALGRNPLHHEAHGEESLRHESQNNPAIEFDDEDVVQVARVILEAEVVRAAAVEVDRERDHAGAEDRPDVERAALGRREARDRQLHVAGKATDIEAELRRLIFESNGNKIPISI